MTVLGGRQVAELFVGALLVAVEHPSVVSFMHILTISTVDDYCDLMARCSRTEKKSLASIKELMVPAEF